MVQFKLTFKIKRLCWSQLKEALQSIYLQNNRLVTLPERIFTRNMQGLKTVMLQENQWACNCSIYWLATWVPGPKNRPNNFDPIIWKWKKLVGSKTRRMTTTKCARRRHVQHAIARKSGSRAILRALRPVTRHYTARWNKFRVSSKSASFDEMFTHSQYHFLVKL